MSFFDKIKVGLLTSAPGADLIGKDSPIQKEQKEQAEETVRRGREAAGLKRAQFEVLQKDVEPLRDLRNENINRLLNLTGVDGTRDLSGFAISPEFNTVRDAALGVEGLNPGQTAELGNRATQLGLGEFENFRNRIFNTAGFSSGGLGSTNRLLQQNVDAQAQLLNNAGALAASGLISGAEQRGQAAGSAVGLLAAFCDIRLKENVIQIGVYDIGIPMYQWDWSEDAKGLVGDQSNTGPLAHEVQEIMPSNVHEIDGYLAIKDMRLIH